MAFIQAPSMTFASPPPPSAPGPPVEELLSFTPTTIALTTACFPPACTPARRPAAVLPRPCCGPRDLWFLYPFRTLLLPHGALMSVVDCPQELKDLSKKKKFVAGLSGGFCGFLALICCCLCIAHKKKEEEARNAVGGCQALF